MKVVPSPMAELQPPPYQVLRAALTMTGNNANSETGGTKSWRSAMPAENSPRMTQVPGLARRSTAAAVPAIPCRKASTQITKMAPRRTVTQPPKSAR